MGRLNLADGARTQIFRALVDRLRTDPTLAASGVEHWLAWEDLEPDNNDLDNYPGPAVRLTPNLRAMAWLFPGTQSGNLVVRMEASLPGLDATDFLNLQDAIEEAFYGNDSIAFVNSLQSMGATTGLVTFINPLTADAPQSDGTDHKWRPMGQFAVEINRNLLAG